VLGLVRERPKDDLPLAAPPSAGARPPLAVISTGSGCGLIGPAFVEEGVGAGGTRSSAASAPVPPEAQPDPSKDGHRGRQVDGRRRAPMSDMGKTEAASGRSPSRRALMSPGRLSPRLAQDAPRPLRRRRRSFFLLTGCGRRRGSAAGAAACSGGQRSAAAAPFCTRPSMSCCPRLQTLEVIQ
jgi:hypothetical protein